MRCERNFARHSVRSLQSRTLKGLAHTEAAKNLPDRARWALPMYTSVELKWSKPTSRKHPRDGIDKVVVDESACPPEIHEEVKENNRLGTIGDLNVVDRAIFPEVADLASRIGRPEGVRHPKRVLELGKKAASASTARLNTSTARLNTSCCTIFAERKWKNIAANT